MSKLLNKRNFFFILIIFFITLFFEIIFFLYFHNNNLKEKLSLYSEKRKSALSHDYFPQVDLVLPYPNTNFTHITSEFVDVFPTKDVLNLGFGYNLWEGNNSYAKVEGAEIVDKDFVVTSVRTLGRASLISFSTLLNDGSKTELEARVSGVLLPETGSRIKVTINLRQAFVFPASTP